jgi:hypothetical protein
MGQCCRADLESVSENSEHLAELGTILHEYISNKVGITTPYSNLIRKFYRSLRSIDRRAWRCSYLHGWLRSYDDFGRNPIEMVQLITGRSRNSQPGLEQGQYGSRLAGWRSVEHSWVRPYGVVN